MQEKRLCHDSDFKGKAKCRGGGHLATTATPGIGTGWHEGGSCGPREGACPKPFTGIKEHS